MALPTGGTNVAALADSAAVYTLDQIANVSQRQHLLLSLNDFERFEGVASTHVATAVTLSWWGVNTYEE